MCFDSPFAVVLVHLFLFGFEFASVCCVVIEAELRGGRGCVKHGHPAVVAVVGSP